MKIADCHAIVTGGASGLGAATAARIVADGGRVTLFDRDSGKGEAHAAALGGAARFRRVDVVDEADMATAVGESIDAFGPLTLMVSCAGVANPGRILGRRGVLPLDSYRTVIEINLIGSFNAMKAAADAMRHNEPDPGGCRGLVVNTASVAAYEGQVGQAAYASSKGGIVGLTLPAARDLAQYGIRVMTVAPGLFLTPLMGSLPADVQESLAANTPFPKRLGTPEEYADLVAAIYANDMLNGEVVRLDGAVRLAPR